MIKIEFTCLTCGKTTDTTEDAISEKTTVPVCDDCYKKFLSQKGKLIKSFQKKLGCIYKEYGIPIDTFNAAEDISDVEL